MGRPTSPRLRRNVQLGEEPRDGLKAPLIGERRKINTFHQRRTAFRPEFPGELRAIVMRIYVAGSLEAMAGIFSCTAFTMASMPWSPSPDNAGSR